MNEHVRLKFLLKNDSNFCGTGREISSLFGVVQSVACKNPASLFVILMKSRCVKLLSSESYRHEMS